MTLLHDKTSTNSTLPLDDMQNLPPLDMPNEEMPLATVVGFHVYPNDNSNLLPSMLDEVHHDESDNLSTLISDNTAMNIHKGSAGLPTGKLLLISVNKFTYFNWVHVIYERILI